MRRPFLALALSLTVGIGLAAAAKPVKHGFTFVGPVMDGWVDLSYRMDHPDTQKFLPAELPREGLVAFASDINDRGFFIAGIEKGRHEFDKSDIENIKDELRRELGGAGSDFVVDDSTMVAIGGVPSAKLFARETIEGHVVRYLVYVVPGKEHAATLIYMAEQEPFSRFLPRFEASAFATRGAVLHKYEKLSREVKGGLVTLVLALLIGGAKAFFKGRTPTVDDLV